ncbi:hypothetical protein PCASD_24222 [Puccinia coronata f. sp. avenae]|uniref:Uncharacterized protein n=1 Tax=Puccinia coronata f. sp. avenae TaxID=200324 RepID=A0A2N5ST09_9BASI|nr:hypothetical protein PCASD_24222 [Puccinia coronata f. sp. avenae]
MTSLAAHSKFGWSCPKCLNNVTHATQHSTAFENNLAAHPQGLWIDNVGQLFGEEYIGNPKGRATSRTAG